jgi:7,8-dihydro-6-hydroxymethylpterin dimethyltransferase
MFYEETQAYCNTCKCNHPAKLYEVDNKILAGLDCPQHNEMSYEISSNAEIYKKIRKRCFIDVTKIPSKNLRVAMHIMPITDACNFNCAACSMNVKPREDANYLSVQEIIKRADLIKADGGKIVNIFGGEPTLHPELFDILERLKPYKFNLAVVTNGLIVGKDPQFAMELKKRGLNRISIQFDSLRSETLKKLGRSYLQEKLQAIQYSLDAGLKVLLNCLVTEHNVNEIPELAQFVADQPPNLFMLALISCAPIGHLAIDKEKLVGREEMIQQLMGDYRGFSIGLNDFIPPITFLPWRMEGHPDCAAMALYIKNNGTLKPLGYYLDFDYLLEKAAKNNMPPGIVSQKLIPFIYLLTSIKKGRRLEVLSLVWKYITTKDKIGLLNIGTTNYKSSDFQDMNKLSRCTVKIYTSQGPVMGENYFFRDETFPGSRLNEQQKNAI